MPSSQSTRFSICRLGIRRNLRSPLVAVTRVSTRRNAVFLEEIRIAGIYGAIS
jgi:hypothetical protein